MNKYLVIYHAPKAEVKGMNFPSEEEKMAAMMPWFAWKEAMGDHLLDFGNPLMGGKKLTPKGTPVESQKEVSGYSLIQANSYDHAIELLNGHPHLASGACEIEVHEAIAM
ncbi:YciI family protein [Marinoscillum pacificum]|uniref:YciI family protein n=1 Tax=Marinoscillum pacificum TaxID=392723 RepID=UPI0021577D4A|nr:YciI family protein [Marinoscillum pacificum]